MLDVTHIPRPQKAQVQEFYSNSLNYGRIASVAIADAIGNLTVTAGDYRVGQAITVTGTFTAGSITAPAYATGTTYYIGSVASTTSIRITNTYYNAINGVFALTTTAGTATPGSVWTLHEHAWSTWTKPRAVSFIHIFALAGGGGGGYGVLGATSTAAGGGGGGSSAQFGMLFPAWALPDRLYISVGQGGFGGTAGATPIQGSSGGATAVSIAPDAQGNHVLAYVFPGGTAAAVATGATAGTAGVAGLATPLVQSLLSGLGFASWGNAATNVTFAGQAGTAGGTTAAGTALTIPVTGLLVTGGSGGAGVGANAAAGSAGGAFTVPAGGVYPPHPGGTGSATNLTAGNTGASGYRAIPKLNYFYGGTGGGSAGGSNTNPLVGGGEGGRGYFGCGGGGGGGGRTGATSGSNGGRGGDGLVIITAW